MDFSDLIKFCAYLLDKFIINKGEIISCIYIMEYTFYMIIYVLSIGFSWERLDIFSGFLYYITYIFYCYNLQFITIITNI